jgi:O-antigen ligase
MVFNNLLFKKDVNLFTELINIVLIVYAALLPFSSAFTVFTAPYILLFLWILEGNWRVKVKKIKSFKPLVFLIIFIIINIISLLWTEDFENGFRNIKYYLAVLIPFLVIFTSLKEQFLKYIINIFLFGMFISEIILYGNAFKWWHLGRGVYNDPSPFMHHSFYSIFLASTIFILIWQILNKKNILFFRVLEFIFLLSALANLFLNAGRAGQLAFIFAAFAFIIFYLGLKFKYIITVFIILLALIFSAYNLSFVFKTRLNQAISDIKKISDGKLHSSFGDRIALKIVAFDLLKQNIFFGVGIGDDFKELKKFTKTKEVKKKYPFLVQKPHFHDQYLQILLQTGVLGFIPFILFLGSFFKEFYKNNLAKATLFTVLLIYIITFFIDVNINAAYPSALFGFLLGILSYAAKKDEVLNEQ